MRAVECLIEEMCRTKRHQEALDRLSVQEAPARETEASCRGRPQVRTVNGRLALTWPRGGEGQRP
jgi:hypothetical protein